MSTDPTPQQPPPAGQNPYAQPPVPPGQNPYAQPPAPAGQNPFAQQPPVPPGQNPYAQPPAGGPQGAPFTYGQPQQPGAFDAAAYPAPAGPMAVAAPQPNASLGILVGIVAAVAAAFAYGWIIGLTKHEIAWAAIGVGFAVGGTVGKVGKRGAVLPYAGLVLSLLGVFLGQYLGEAILAAHESGMSVSTVLLDYTHEVFVGWKADSDVLSYLFMAIAGVVGFRTPLNMSS